MPKVPTDPESAPAPFQLTALDREILSQTDEEYNSHDWENLKDIIATNSLHLFKRKPSDLANYISWSTAIKSLYGTITNYICLERLRWPLNLDPATQCVDPTPFADSRDYRILRNDWPYGVTPDISHLVVWVKNAIPVDEQTGGDLTPESRTSIDEFVHRTFVVRLEEEFPDAKARVMWFKNWTALQSVRSLEHIHVLVRGVPDEIIFEWTGEPARKLSDPTVGLENAPIPTPVV
ncbi:hypothetical protein D8B26_000281 [Coccidioides posadasii str. Silveira]|uniref:Uncharacterized protein n=1 Tax=Coccidioides posadasii (strain RMSCC 757 / Silveira) TaxID=443226 RepID=E9D885_COCPS|nr:conserved hypothetical protein [Coccidioides posadasii str. Silveira]QVM05575.1 hypothetical protein D8B26_000281 [Coccidioides posadasii str. Silveira]